MDDMMQLLKTNWKRILSVVIVAALIFGVYTPILKAEPSPTIVKRLWLTDNANQNSNNRRIYTLFEADDLTGLTINGWDNRFKPADANSGIFVNGSETAADPGIGYAYQRDLGRGLFLENFGTLEVGDYLTVKGTFVSASTNESLTIQNATRFTWKGDADKWEVSYEAAEPVRINSLYLTNATNSNSNSTSIYTLFEADDLTGLTINGWNNRFKPADANSGIYVNGSETAVDPGIGYAYQAELGRGLYLENFGTLEVGDYLTVRGTFVSASTNESFTIRNAMRFTWKGDTDRWVVSYDADAVPTNITFEDLATTKQVKLVEVGSGKEETLGTLADSAHGFKFRISSITAADTEDEASKDLKISLYNPLTNMWQGGYHLLLRRGTTQGVVNWFILDAARSQQLAYGQMTGVPETLEVYAWVSDVTDTEHTLNIIANGKRILSKEMDGSVVLGTNLQVYNVWNTAMTIHTFDQDVPAPDEPILPPDEPILPPDEPIIPDATIPADVIFEDLAKTIEKNTVEMASKKEGSLGALTDTAHGFKFKVSGISITNAEKEIKIALYNPESSIWQGGYHLRLVPGTTQGVVDWTIIDQAGNKQLMSGQLTDVPEIMEVYVWVSDVTSTGHTLNIIANGKRILLKEMDGSVTLGTNLHIYNGWDNAVTLHTFQQYNGNDSSADVTIPTNVTFEDLAKTMKVNTVEVASGKEGALGTLTNTKRGFKVKLSSISTANAEKDLKIGLYNPESSIWYGGYNLVLRPGTKQGVVDWILLNPVTGKQLAFGTIEDVPKTMEIYTWVSDVKSSGHTLNIIANGTLIFSKAMGNGVKLGTNLHVYNGWGSAVTFSTYAQYVKEDVKLPSNVVFEDLAKTIKMDVVEMASQKEGSLGTLADISHGFKVKLSSITTANAGKDLKVGLFNPKASIWTGGYNLLLRPGTKQGVVDWALLNPVTSKQLAFGSIADVPETMEIYAWVSDVKSSGHTLNIMANGTLIFSKAMGNGVKLGTNLQAYNGWTTTAVFYTYDKYVKVAAKLPKNVVFEDLSKTAQVNYVEMASKSEGSLGTLSDVTHGFKFKLGNVGLSNAGKEVKVCLFNPTSSPWTGGYNLRLVPGTKQGVVEWEILNPVTSKILAAGAIADAPEMLEVYAWVSDITAGGHTLNIIADGQLIFAKKMDGSVKLGKKLQVYNGWANSAVFYSFDEVVRVKAKIPADITFEDIGSAMLKKQVEVPNKTYVTLSIISSEKNGFQFMMSTPEGTDYGRYMKIGLYNTTYHPWANGYILEVRPNNDGSIYFSLARGKTNEILTVVPAFTDIKHGDTFKITTWIATDPSKPGTHTMTVVLNDIELLKYTCEDASIMLGRYMTVYSEWEKTVALLAVSDTETLQERYLRIFGDPTAMTEGNGVSNNKNNHNNTSVPKRNVTMAVLGGVVVVVLEAIAITVVLLVKKRKKKLQAQ